MTQKTQDVLAGIAGGTILATLIVVALWNYWWGA